MTDQSRRGVMWHDQVIILNGNALTKQAYTGQMHAIRAYQNAAADADQFSHGCYLRKGTYTLYYMGITSTTRGKIDWTLDGNSIETGQDWYSGSEVKNVIKSTANVSVTFDGWHTLVGTVNGKNASSSNYIMTLTKYWFEPAAD